MEKLVEQAYSLDRAREYIDKNRKSVNETFRNNYHLMPPVGWMNDPNGFVYYKGEYHLFYQFYPYDSKWGPMHWGHSKTKDFIHWEELPTALAPDEAYDKDGCFSGSAIEKDGKLYLMYTGHLNENGKVIQTQCVAVSEDGVHFTKYKSNPVIGENEIGEYGMIQDFRDPKVIEKDGIYYSVVASKTADDRGLILLYQSSDMYEWTFYSVLLEGNPEQGVMWECPDLFHLDGKDVLIMSPIQMKPQGIEYHNTSSTAVFVGEMDWEKGTLQVDNIHEIDHGLDFYAPQTLKDDQGRRIMVAWMQMWGRTFPTDELGHGWAGSMTLPRELGIKENKLYQKPVSEIYKSIAIEDSKKDFIVDNEVLEIESGVAKNQYYKLKVDTVKNKSFSLTLLGTDNGGLILDYDKDAQLLTLSRNNYGHKITGDEESHLTQRQVFVEEQLIELEIFMDTTSIEVFVNNEKTMTFTFYKEVEDSNLKIYSDGVLKVLSLDIGSVEV
ncbi:MULTISPECIES: glycoside hydrolase family 32 protein [unclassified Jeotgalibaca]|uniref:glycoside hydrolase family 32 protein n=1 Tax=unclassified Jeotgalibaca TaxID=2621505 RepID=UPI003FD23CAE